MGLWQTIRIFHRLINGDGANKLKNLTTWNASLPNLVWVFYFSASFLLVIIMLNLLIALIGDQYNKVIGLSR